jgi:hypothetical protein
MQQQAGHNDEQRGFSNARNAKLHHLAKQKRGSKGGQTARLSGSHPAKPVLLSSVLAQTPQMFDSFKVMHKGCSISVHPNAKHCSGVAAVRALTAGVWQCAPAWQCTQRQLLVCNSCCPFVCSCMRTLCSRVSILCVNAQPTPCFQTRLTIIQPAHCT